MAWSYQHFQNVAQEWCAEQLVCVIPASCHKQCSLPRYQPVASALCLWFLTQCTIIHDFSSSVFLEECLLLECAAWLKENSSAKLSVSYTDFSKSSTNACKFHLAIFVCLNFPCAFFSCNHSAGWSLILSTKTFAGRDKIKWLSPMWPSLALKLMTAVQPKILRGFCSFCNSGDGLWTFTSPVSPTSSAQVWHRVVWEWAESPAVKK